MNSAIVRSAVRRQGTYYGLTVLSAIVATAGLLLDSPATRRLDGHRSSGRIRTHRPRRDDAQRPPLIVDGVRDQLLGLAVVIGSAALFGLFIRYSGLSPDSSVSRQPADRPAYFTGVSLA